MKICYIFAAALLTAVPLAGAFAQGGTMPHINATEAKEWANGSNHQGNTSHPAEAQSKAMPSQGSPSAGTAPSNTK